MTEGFPVFERGGEYIGEIARFAALAEELTVGFGAGLTMLNPKIPNSEFYALLQDSAGISDVALPVGARLGPEIMYSRIGDMLMPEQYVKLDPSKVFLVVTQSEPKLASAQAQHGPLHESWAYVGFRLTYELSLSVGTLDLGVVLGGNGIAMARRSEAVWAFDDLVHRVNSKVLPDRSSDLNGSQLAQYASDVRYLVNA